MTDSLLFSIGCGVTAIAFGGVYVYMRGRFEQLVDPPRSQRGAQIQNREDIPDQSTRRSVVTQDRVA